jgi:hypothetical protein
MYSSRAVRRVRWLKTYCVSGADSIPHHQVDLPEKYSDIKFPQNPFSGSRVAPCGRIDTTKLIVAFRNFANAPTNLLNNLINLQRHSQIIESGKAARESTSKVVIVLS